MFEVRVPATSANLGPGFDSLGIALNIYGKFVFEKTCSPPEANHLTIMSYKKTLERLQVKGPDLRVRIPQVIPVGKGLGSSAACIVAGVLAAKHVSGKDVSKHELLQIAAEIEGHPDNVAPALIGGLVSSGLRDGEVFSGRLFISRKISFALLIPTFSLATSKSRKVLPKSVPFSDASYNLSQLGLSISALASGDPQLICHAFDDRLHQPYRFPLIDEAERLIELAKENGALAVALSGAGPSLLLIRQKGDRLEGLIPGLAECKSPWRLRLCRPDMKGALLREL
jgi:homoserine kinase